jgi:DNA-binding XRE family transcriptional regulator
MKTKTRNGLPLRDFLKDELKDPEIKRHYENAAIEWQVATKVSEARHRANLTQAELARKLHTSQQAISRIEAGEQNTTVAMLWKIAQALKMKLEFGFRPKHA